MAPCRRVTRTAARQVAEWAGNSAPVLLAAYARCVDGQLPDLKKRLEAAGDLPELPDAG
ncbi:integrase [Streptomyces albidoflavus]|nr:integrase [Streptomyces albidoflavus]